MKTEVEDIDISKLINAFLSQKWAIAIFTVLSTVAGALYALNLPNTYTSNTQLMPENSLGNNSKAGLGALSGGLSLLGLDASNHDKYVSIAMKLFEGETFIGNFLRDKGLEKEFYAAESWEPSSNTIIFDDEKFDGKSWLLDSSALRGSAPTDKELSESFRKHNLSYELDEKSGFISLSITHVSPYVAHNTVELLIKHINETLRVKAIELSNKKINYLKKAAESADNSELRAGFLNMLVLEEKEKMLASVKSDFVFSVIDMPTIPTEKSGPRRALLVALFIVAGGFLGLFYAAIKYFFFTKRV